MLTDDHMDEDLNDAVDSMCKAVMDYIRPINPALFGFFPETDIILNSRLPAQDSWSSSSRFLAFSDEYKSKFNKFMEGYSRVGVYPKKDVLWGSRPIIRPTAMLDDKGLLNSYKNFKRFDKVVDYSDHLFCIPLEQMPENSQLWAERIQEEWKYLEEKLPDTIFVRVYESRMDLLRAVIIGAKGTPYHDGLFFFDVYFPPMIPSHPPLLRYHSGGFAINPHLFECGEVRLNIIKTFTPPSRRLWPASHSSVLRLLVSIQDRVLNADPLFHQPGLLDSGPSVVAEYFSLLYNEDILIKSLKTMMHIMNKPPKHFEGFVVGHFRNRALDILKACEAYMEGLPVGCVVGNKDMCCSKEFRNDVASCMEGLVNCFNKVGATESKIPISGFKRKVSEIPSNSSITTAGLELVQETIRKLRDKPNDSANTWKSLSAVMNFFMHKLRSGTRRAAQPTSAMATIMDWNIPSKN